MDRTGAGVEDDRGILERIEDALGSSEKREHGVGEYPARQRLFLGGAGRGRFATVRYTRYGARARDLCASARQRSPPPPGTPLELPQISPGSPPDLPPGSFPLNSP